MSLYSAFLYLHSLQEIDNWNLVETHRTQTIARDLDIARVYHLHTPKILTAIYMYQVLNRICMEFLCRDMGVQKGVICRSICQTLPYQLVLCNIVIERMKWKMRIADEDRMIIIVNGQHKDGTKRQAN